VGSIEEGVKQAVENCLKVKAGESVVIMFHPVNAYIELCKLKILSFRYSSSR